jgi:hypothetical protein
MEIFKLFGSIFVDTDKAEKSIQKTDDKALDLGKTLAKGAEKAGKFGLAIAGGAAAAGTAILSLANDTASTADEIDKASIRMGISAESFQELRYAAEQSGVEVSALEKAAKKLEGTDLNMDDAMAQIMALGTEEERAAKAAELFGESVAYSMAPMLQMTGEEMDAMRKRANDLGIVMSGDNVKAGVKFGDTMADIKKSLSALVTAIGTAVMPIVQKFADMVLAFLPQIQSAMDMIIPVVVALAEAALPPLMDLIEEILPVVLNLIEQLMPFLSMLIAEIMPVIVSLLQMLLPYLTDIISALLPVLMSLLQSLMPILELAFTILDPILNLVLSLIDPLLKIITSILTPMTSLIDGLVKGPLAKLTPALEGLAEIFSGVLGTALEFVFAKIDLAVTAFQGLLEFITKIFVGDWEGAWKVVVDTFGNVFEGIVNVAKIPINAIIKMLNAAIDGINSIKIPDWVPGVGGANLNLQKLPMLYNGGIVEEPGAVMVGEFAPEILELPRGARVSPLGSTQIDYEKLREVIKSVLRELAPLLRANVQINGDIDRFIEAIIEENDKSISQSGEGLFAT